MEAFTRLLQKYDPAITSENASEVFEICGASGKSVRISAFLEWLELMFGTDDVQVEEGN